MTITPFAGRYIALLRNPHGHGGYIAQGATYMEAFNNVISKYYQDRLNILVLK